MRYFVAFLLIGALTVLGGIGGLLLAARLPKTYTSSVRLLIQPQGALENQRDLGMTSFHLARSMLHSDRVSTMVLSDQRMQPFLMILRERHGEDPRAISRALQENLLTESESAGESSTIISIRYEDSNPGLCKVVIDVFAHALMSAMSEMTAEPSEQILEQFSKALEHQRPRLQQLEQQHAEFRRETSLPWDDGGNLANPHSARLSALTEQFASSTTLLAKKEHQLAQLDAIAMQDLKPDVALRRASELLGISLDSLTKESSKTANGQDDKKLALTAERIRLQGELGENHPRVIQLSKELSALEAAQTDTADADGKGTPDATRIDGSESRLSDSEAKGVLSGIVVAKRSEASELKNHLAELEQQIKTEKQAAEMVASAQTEDESRRRELERTRELINRIEEGMAKASMVEDQTTTTITLLTESSVEQATSPRTTLTELIGAVIGFVFGFFLALGLLLTLMIFTPQQREEPAFQNA